MNRVVLPLNGGVDKDKSKLYIDSEKGEVFSRKNCRVVSPEGSRYGTNVSLKGMEEIDPSYNSGDNKVIGYVEDKERDQGIFFVYNASGNHGIYKISGSTVTDLGAVSSALDFDEDEIIDADILGDYCVFVSDYNPPRKIDITSSLAGLDAFDIQLAVRPPYEKPTTELGSDSSRVVNKLVGKTFQFSYMYVYDDYTYSVVSPYSDLVVSSSVFSAEDNTYTDNAVGNFVNVTYDLGHSNVRAVRLLAREGNIGDWFIVEEYETGGSGGTRTYPFYNDVAREALTETEALNLYSDVPRLARSVQAVQNRIGLANVLKGYDKTSPVVEYSVEYETVSVTGNTSDLTSSIVESQSGTSLLIEFPVPVDGSISEGDVFSISLHGFYQGGVSSTNLQTDLTFEYSFSYTVTADDISAGAQSAVQNQLRTDILNKMNEIVTNYTIYNGVSYPNAIINVVSYLSGGSTIMDFVNAYGSFAYNSVSYLTKTYSQESLPTGVNTYKSGSYYNVGVLFYDDFNRTSGVLDPKRIYIPHAGERDYANAFDRAKINFAIPNASQGVPSWAKYYRFAVTESVNFAGVYPFYTANDTATNIRDIYLDGQAVLAINMPTNLQYEFAKGDYLLIEVDSGSAITSTIVKNIIGTRTLIEDGGTEYAGFWLIVPQGTESVSDYSEQLCYIYRLKDEVSEQVFFEDSNTYTVSGGAMQTVSGEVKGADAWWVQRKFEWDNGSSSEKVEDFYINVDDAIRAYSKGRVVVEVDSLGEIRLQDFVWSFNYLDNTKINGISTFNSQNREQLDEKDGQIQRIKLVGFVLKAIQDNKETSIYIGKDEVSNADGSLSLVKSNDFVGTVRASTDDYGSRFPRSIVRYNRNLYYFDSDHGKVIRSSPNGQFVISDYGMRSEFLRLKRDIESATSSDVFAYYDARNDEYVITFVIDSTVQTLVFKEGADQWVMDDFELMDTNGDSADFYGNIGEQVYSFGFEKVWRHERTTSYNAFYGEIKPFFVSGVLNTIPTEDKVLLALKMDSNGGLDTTITSPVTNTRIVGQKSILYSTTYREREGSYTSSVFKNILQAGGSENLDLLHIGDDMVGKYLEIELSNTTSTEVQLRTLGCTYNLKI